MQSQEKSKNSGMVFFIDNVEIVVSVLGKESSFMIWIGPTSSIFDFTAYIFMYFVFRPMFVSKGVHGSSSADRDHNESCILGD